MTKRSLALISFALLACVAAQAAPKKKHTPASTQDVPAQDIDVDAMARAKDAGATPAADVTDAAPTIDASAPAPAAEPPAATPPEAATSATPATSDVTESKAAEPASGAMAPMERPSSLAPPAASSDVDKSIAAGCESRAKGLLDAAQKGDYAGATRDFDAKMRTALPPPKFKQAWESLAQFGTLQARGQTHPMKGEGYIAITVPLIFDKANLYAQVACGSDGRIAGFYIKPL